MRAHADRRLRPGAIGPSRGRTARIAAEGSMAMNMGRLVRFLLAGVGSLGMTILGPAASSATNMWADQAIILVHVPLGGGLFFTTNHVFTASAGGNTAINVK